MSDTPLVDWKNDESVVRAAVPNLRANQWAGNGLFVIERIDSDGMSILGANKIEKLAWDDARRNNSTVVAFEAAHNPAKRNPTSADLDAVADEQRIRESPALPEEMGFEEWWDKNCAKLVATLEGEDDMDSCGQSIARAAWDYRESLIRTLTAERDAKEEAEEKWIPVSESFPPPEQVVDVWLITGRRVPDVRYEWNGGTEGFWDWHFADGPDEGHSFQEIGLGDSDGDRSPVTHWQPLPVPPKSPQPEEVKHGK